MSKLANIIERTFMAGYECGKKPTGLQMVIASDVIEPAANQQVKALFLELIGPDITAIDTSDQSYWGEDYKRTHDMQVEYHNNLLKRLRQRVEEL